MLNPVVYWIYFDKKIYQLCYAIRSREHSYRTIPSECVIWSWPTGILLRICAIFWKRTNRRGGIAKFLSAKIIYCYQLLLCRIEQLVKQTIGISIKFLTAHLAFYLQIFSTSLWNALTDFATRMTLCSLLIHFRCGSTNVSRSSKWICWVASVPSRTITSFALQFHTHISALQRDDQRKEYMYNYFLFRAESFCARKQRERREKIECFQFDRVQFHRIQLSYRYRRTRRNKIT